MENRFGMRRFLFILLTVWVLLPGLSLSTHAAMEVRVGVYQNKPKVFIDENKKAAGFYIDLLEHIAESEDWHIQYIPGTWSQCLERLEKGQIDLLPDIAFSKDRTLHFDFNHKTVLSNWAVVYTLKGAQIESFNDLKGKKIAFMRGDITIEQFDSEIKPYGIEFSTVEADDYQGVFKLIVQGKADAGLVNHLFGMRNEKQYNIARSPIICCPRELRFAVPKNKNSHLLLIIDQYLETYKKNRESIYYQIRKQWIEGPSPWEFPKGMLWVLLIAGGLVALFMVITAVSRFQVNSKTAELLAVNKTLRKEMDEHKNTSEVLQKSEERLRLSTELANVAIWEYDFTTNCMSRSKNHDLLYGLEWQTKWDITTFLNATHPDDREVSNTIIEKSVAANGPDQYTFDFRVVYPDQSVHWLMVTGQVVERDLQGQGTLVRGCLIDITERKRTEEALGQEHAFSNAILDSLPGVFYLYDENLRFLRWNKNFTRVTGYTDTEMACLNPLDFFTGPDKEILADRIQDVFTKGESSVEADFVSRDGTHTPYFFTGLRTWIGGKVCLLGIGIDIAARKRAEEELHQYRNHLEDLVKERTQSLEKNQKALMNVVEDLNEKTDALKIANVRLKELDQLKNIFLASMSHELRTPLNSIIGFTGILLMGLTGELTGEQKKQLNMVKNSAHHLLDLINDILDISKVEAGMMDAMPEEFNLDSLIGETMAGISVAVKEKGLELIYKGPSDLFLFSDPKRIRQIILNLLSNAVKFTEHGSIHLMVQSIKTDQKPFVQICVTDTGMGIKKEDINRLFFPFQQVDAALTKKFEGTGLGLYLSKKLANMLGGDVTVKSEYGRGSRFLVELPLRIDKKE